MLVQRRLQLRDAPDLAHACHQHLAVGLYGRVADLHAKGQHALLAVAVAHPLRSMRAAQACPALLAAQTPFNCQSSRKT